MRRSRNGEMVQMAQEGYHLNTAAVEECGCMLLTVPGSGPIGHEEGFNVGGGSVNSHFSAALTRAMHATQCLGPYTEDRDVGRYSIR